jgi:outer membrane protein assembly factor BamB
MFHPIRFATWCLLIGYFVSSAVADPSVSDTLEGIGLNRGVVAVLDVPGGGATFVVELANSSELTVYFQSANGDQIATVRKAAEKAGLLGRRIFVDAGSLDTIHLANNVADGILVSPSARGKTTDEELLRALRPRAKALLGDRSLVKAVPEGIDEWTHPYHGPDNNPQSEDQLARGSFRTQFLAEPKFSPMPEQTVVAGGRIFKAMGHIAHKANQNEMLNTLLCINAYNGTILWKRALPSGFMLHRNTMIATEDALLMGDAQSCKVIDAATGEVREEITVPAQITDGPVWKWMAMRDGILYGLVGNSEIQVDTQKSDRRGLGHWPWGMWKGHDYTDPRTSFGFGRTLVAIDLKTKEILWQYQDDEFLDARAVCMNRDRIFCFSPERFLACINLDDGQLLWKNADEDLLSAIGPDTRAQHYVTGYATTCYMKCNDQFVFFAGPQRKQMVVASAENGSLSWTHPHGNLQLVLRDDAIYAAGPGTTGLRLDYTTGQKLSSLPTRRSCTRATGCVDSIFYRTAGGTVRVMTETNTAQHIAPMRPPCQDGVIVSNGHLYWGPWMCGCQLSLYGHIGLAPASQLENQTDVYADARWATTNIDQVEPIDVRPGDWTTFRGDNARTDVTGVAIPAGVKLAWQVEVSSAELPTAPVAAGGMVFLANRAGVVRALDSSGNEVWQAYTSGPVFYPPAVAHDRVYVGSADGRVYAYEARTGRLLWTFRVAPEDRWIPIYGKLMNAWPVAGGVVVDDGTVYAAAGIAHYDGTYVVALDALTGALKAHNSTSGTLSVEVNSGISLQGKLMIAEGELRFLAGNVYETARYDLKTLECLNTPKVQVTSQFRTAFYPFYPLYGKYVSLEHTRTDRSTLVHDASYEGSRFGNLALQSPLPPGVPKEKQEAARWERRHGNAEPKVLWQDKADRRFTSFVVSGDTLLVTGHPDADSDRPFLAAINIEDGSDAWVQPLPAEAVKGGTAIDSNGWIYVALENGSLLCFVPDKT